MTYNAAHRKPSEPSRWDRARAWLAGWLDWAFGREWHHGLTDGELAEEFPEDLPRPGQAEQAALPPGPGQPYEPPERQVVTAILKDGVYLLLTGGPPVDLRKYLWEPRVCARRNARLIGATA